TDLSRTNIEAATETARQRGLDALVSFEVGDAEALPYDGSFDAVICECAFCTFPDKAAAARSMARAVRPGGRLGFTDLIRTRPLPRELDGLLAWIACVADARPPEEYRDHLEAAGFRIEVIEDHRPALVEMVRAIQGRLLGAKIMVEMRKVALPGVDLTQAGRLARAALAAVRDGTLSYVLLTGRRA
ncbi:MAG: methyltransferase domain-containing protein, partial [Candidatus Dormiibacterota bacterium]